jgi:hypothetical protein
MKSSAVRFNACLLGLATLCWILGTTPDNNAPAPTLASHNPEMMAIPAPQPAAVKPTVPAIIQISFSLIRVPLPRYVPKNLPSNDGLVLNQALLEKLLTDARRDNKLISQKVSAPQLCVFNDQKASMAVGERRAYIAGYAMVDNVYDPIINALPELLQVSVQPHCNANDSSIDLELQCTVDEEKKRSIKFIRGEALNLPIETVVLNHYTWTGRTSLRETQVCLVVLEPDSHPGRKNAQSLCLLVSSMRCAPKDKNPDPYDRPRHVDLEF